MNSKSSATAQVAPAGPRVLIESGNEPPVVAAGPDVYTLAGSTTNFDVYYDSSLGAGGQTLANAILASCEADLAALMQLFGVGPPARFATFINPGTGGASHATCLNTDLYCSSWSGDGGLENFLNCAEVDEVLMAAQAIGWNCGASAGEGLSRALAFELHPMSSWLPANQNRGLFVTANNWLNGGRPDWVTQTEGTDQDKVSIGCATLFINYLRHQLDYSLAQIVQAGGTTLQQTYERLTGSSDAFGPFADLLFSNFPPGVPVNLPTDNPFPLVPLVHVPDTMGLPVNGAARVVEMGGLVPEFTGASGPNLFVKSQFPKPGARVPRGSVVSMVLARGEPP